MKKVLYSCESCKNSLESGHPSKGEGCDFILEAKNRQAVKVRGVISSSRPRTDRPKVGYLAELQKKNTGSNPVEIWIPWKKSVLRVF
jgi:hypothetical protein